MRSVLIQPMSRYVPPTPVNDIVTIQTIPRTSTVPTVQRTVVVQPPVQRTAVVQPPVQIQSVQTYIPPGNSWYYQCPVCAVKINQDNNKATSRDILIKHLVSTHESRSYNSILENMNNHCPAKGCSREFASIGKCFLDCLLFLNIEGVLQVTNLKWP